MLVDYRYDGTFPGLLSVIFEIYESGNDPSSIYRIYQSSQGLFSHTTYVETKRTNYGRVLDGLLKKVSGNAIRNMYKSMLTEFPTSEMHIFGMIKHIFSSGQNVEGDMRNQHVSEIGKMSRKTMREVNKAQRYLNFFKVEDHMNLAILSPAYDIVPLLVRFYEKKHHGQSWLLYDVKRDYGLIYMQGNVKTVYLDYVKVSVGVKNNNLVHYEKEKIIESLWSNYQGIEKRKDFFPERYWHFVPDRVKF